MSQAQTTGVPPIWSCDTHRRSHNPQRELKQQQQLQLSTLVTELRRATNHWFQTKGDDCFQLLVQTCVQILQHGLLQPTTSNATLRLVEDFEFLRLTELQQALQHQPSGKGTSRNRTVGVTEFLQQWVASCLHSRCLSRCIQSLVADKELLDTYYQRDVAYLRHSGHATALFVCLTAVQLDQSSLLSQLEPLHKRRHRRTSSQPNFSQTMSQRLHVVQEEEHLPRPRSLYHPQQQQCNLLRRIKSLPSLYPSDASAMDGAGAAAAASVVRPRCQTYNSPRARWGRTELPALSGSTISTASSCSQVSPSPSPRRIQLINCDDIKIWTDQTTSSNNNNSNNTPTTPIAPATLKRMQCLKRASPLNSILGNLFGSPPLYTSWYNRNLGQEDEASSVLDNFLPINGRKLDKRHQQSLFEGVSMLDYNNCEAEAQLQTEATPTTLTTPPVDIMGSPVVMSQEYNSASCSSNTTPCSLSSDSNSNSNKMDNQSLAAFLQMSRYTHNNTELEKENAHFRISEACITAIEHVKWSRRRQQQPAKAEDAAEAAAGAAVQTDVDSLLIPYVEQHNSNSNNNSAEAVGLQLISRFKDQQLPKLADLKWLVSEQDTPQQLLPMPKLQQEQQQQLHEEELQQSSLTRGTRTWAPPRQQIIFTEHAPASRSQLLTRQHYRCAGCGMHVTRQLQQHFRYCNYLGKYLCTGCHRNQLSAIPAKILQSWDFRSYPVSSFAYRLIEQMYTFPLFHVPDLNAQLYAKQKVLAKERRRRQQLRYVRDFIAACRFATREQALFNAVPAHITNDPDMWSMCDFVDVQNSSMRRSIEDLIALSEQHVNNCVLCTGRAFVCEYCKSPKLIYRWQRKVQRCGQCGTCCHYNCWKANSGGSCQRCDRLQGRLHQRSAPAALSNTNSMGS
ncbi:run domain Beclin-1-interacting and cysteine-rich domain-containing protein [Drosophila innubila]|uniref:run domain Beclin-1-interacting and cysteine-rich domain-containing protein n=1 Tax=Drosophila innubila TaxID=198719 RepID=UPI00148E0B6D|nr:run domain Beclin-1-interacting and cysteine-rich domain-containing protein [Drosophila innubila]